MPASSRCDQGLRSTLGLPALREAIASFYFQEYRVKVEPEQIIITPGSATALQLVLTMMISDGDAVVIPDPAYPSTHNLVRLLGGSVLQIAVNEDSSWQLTLDQREAHWDDSINAVLLASPSNPTGTIIDAGIESLRSGITQYLWHDRLAGGLDRFTKSLFG